VLISTALASTIALVALTGLPTGVRNSLDSSLVLPARSGQGSVRAPQGNNL
jgi:hypothetical protein